MSSARLSDHSNGNPRQVPRLVTNGIYYARDAVVADPQSSEENNSDVHASRRRTVESQATFHLLRQSPSSVLRHTRNDSSHSHGRESPRHRHPSKRKSNGVLGFLTLKEPSTAALEDFAEHAREKAAHRGASSAAMVIPGVSSQKLPSHVPKVNSKWNGLPEPAKRKHAEHRPDAEDAKRNAASSLHVNRNGDSVPKRLYGSLSSKPSLRWSRSKKCATFHVMEISKMEDEVSTPLSAYSPSLSGTHPAFRWPVRSESDPSASLPELEFADLSGLALSSPEASPKTPGRDALPTFLTSSPGGTRAFTSSSDGIESLWNDDSGEIIVKTSGPDVLAPRPKITKTLHRQSANIANTSLSKSAVSSDDTQVRSFSHRTENQSPSAATTSSSLDAHFQLRRQASSRSDLSRLQTASSDSSGLSTQFKPPSQARLGLGAKIKKDEVAPWEMFEPPVVDSTTRADPSKFRRLSYKLGMK